MYSSVLSSTLCYCEGCFEWFEHHQGFVAHSLGFVQIWSLGTNRTTTRKRMESQCCELFMLLKLDFGLCFVDGNCLL
jgi:hypothetical protein